MVAHKTDQKENELRNGSLMGANKLMSGPSRGDLQNSKPYMKGMELAMFV